MTGVLAARALGTAGAETPTDQVDTAPVAEAGLYQPLPAARDVMPANIFKLGITTFHAQAKWWVLPALDMGPATVSRTDDQITFDVGKDHVTVRPDPKSPDLVLITWAGKGRYEARVQSHNGSFEADTLDGHMKFGLTQLPDGRIQADATGVAPGTAHLFLTPSS